MKTLAWMLVLGAVAWAQEPPAQEEPDSLKGVVQKKLAPVSKEVLRVKLPPVVERKMKNGLPVMLLSSRRTPVISLTLHLPATPLLDPPGLPGLASATASLMTEGTEKYDARQIAERLALLGATVNVGGGAAGGGGRGRRGGGGGPGESIRLTASCLAEDLDAVLEIAGQVLLHPTFPQAELDRWKNQQRSRLQQMRSSVTFLAEERMRELLYAGDARASGGATAESIDKIKREDLVAFYKAHFRPGGSLLGVAGDIAPDALLAKLEKHLGEWAPGSAPKPSLATRPPIAAKKVVLVDRPGSVQTQLVLANRAIARTDPDYIACMVMNRILGAGPAARLFRNIREEKGYTYGVSSSFTATRYSNHFSAASSVRTEVTGPALEEFLKEFRAIREKTVPAEELEDAKRALVASFALSLESAGGVLAQRMQSREYGLPDDYWDTYAAKVMAVTAADVQRVAARYVPLDNIQLIAVGDGARITEVLARFGPVEKFDAEGRPVR